jgi:nucleotide-binding universal stress UspA family protein
MLSLSKVVQCVQRSISMRAFKRILCPTDFSKFSFRASDYAVTIARHHSGEVHYLHVIPDVLLHPDQYPYLAEPVRASEELKGQASERLDAFVALAHAEKISTRFSVETGSPVSTILAVADRDDADLICLGTHGREGFERLVLGSVAEKILRKAKSPVLTVSEPGTEEAFEPAPFDRIVCAVDFAEMSLKALEHGVSLAAASGGKLTLVNVVEWFLEEPGWEAAVSAPDYRREMEDSVRKRLEGLVPEGVREKCEVHVVVRSGKAYREVLTFAEEADASLIILGVRGRNPLDIMLFGSTAHHVVRHSKCPVLTVSG